MTLNNVDALWSQFEVENNAVLECLILLDLVEEYSIDLIPEGVRLLTDNVSRSYNASEMDSVNANAVNQGNNQSFKSQCHNLVVIFKNRPLSVTDLTC